MSIEIRIPNVDGVKPLHPTPTRRASVQGLLTNGVNPETPRAYKDAPFSQFLSEAVSNVAGSDYVDKISNVGLMTGTLDNMHTATIAAEKADLMLNLTVQVRNKLVEGYQEIMRMQM